MSDLKNSFVHMVLFWLKEPENTEHRKTFEVALKKLLKESKYAKSGHVGKPQGSDREVVDSSYTFSLLVIFDSPEDELAYQTEQAHLDFISTGKTLWEKVQVFDSLAL